MIKSRGSSIPSCSPRRERHVQHLGSASPDVFSATVIAGGRRALRVPGKLLDGADVDAEVEHVPDERPPKIVGREAGDSRPRNLSTSLRHAVDEFTERCLLLQSPVRAC